jgi:hypothetical protein
MHIVTEKLTLSPGSTVDLEAGTRVVVAADSEIELLGTLKAPAATALIIPTYTDAEALPTPTAAIYGAIGYLSDQVTLCVCTADGWKIMALAGHTHT